MEEIFSLIKYDKDGLFVSVVQDMKGEILMVAWMNKQALEKTLNTGKMHYYSRSRKKLWLKGEESGNYQFVREIYIDCDGDVLLFKVEQKGGACHEGYYSCFFRKYEDGKFKIVKEKIFEPEKVYKK
ncbi:MAG: phosphoribosyl-AMP cyclohydrolase [Candidatus Omnitrophica bacterium]|nr:phosphoribosyl-AMP cyclohydrolase [Candidatus Omnitrophota bacterium]MCM8808592.1 phosphoribosyl-AMP cyclohydrolase [Candidatus Omnitrophota bacterium]MCM8833009.1 phosphoribosyl-AMP cyclohydrolase [Candidatus Omnitrophota bacterium]